MIGPPLASVGFQYIGAFHSLLHLDMLSRLSVTGERLLTLTTLKDKGKK